LRILSGGDQPKTIDLAAFFGELILPRYQDSVIKIQAASDVSCKLRYHPTTVRSYIDVMIPEFCAVSIVDSYDSWTIRPSLESYGILLDWQVRDRDIGINDIHKYIHRIGVRFRLYSCNDDRFMVPQLSWTEIPIHFVKASAVRVGVGNWMDLPKGFHPSNDCYFLPLKQKINMSRVSEVMLSVHRDHRMTSNSRDILDLCVCCLGRNQIQVDGFSSLTRAT
jgi:hypothetical protein